MQLKNDLKKNGLQIAIKSKYSIIIKKYILSIFSRKVKKTNKIFHNMILKMIKI